MLSLNYSRDEIRLRPRLLNAVVVAVAWEALVMSMLCASLSGPSARPPALAVRECIPAMSTCAIVLVHFLCRRRDHWLASDAGITVHRRGRPALEVRWDRVMEIHVGAFCGISLRHGVFTGEVVSLPWASRAEGMKLRAMCARHRSRAPFMIT